MKPLHFVGTVVMALLLPHTICTEKLDDLRTVDRKTSELLTANRRLLSTEEDDPKANKPPPSFKEVYKINIKYLTLQTEEYIYNIWLQSFEAHVRVTNLVSKEVYEVREKRIGDRVTLKMTRFTEDKEQFCTYSKSTGFGHTIYGERLWYQVLNDIARKSWGAIKPTIYSVGWLRRVIYAHTNTHHRQVIYNFTVWPVFSIVSYIQTRF